MNLFVNRVKYKVNGTRRKVEHTLTCDLHIKQLAVITRPPDGVLLAPSALAARRLRRLASLLEL